MRQPPLHRSMYLGPPLDRIKLFPTNTPNTNPLGFNHQRSNLMIPSRSYGERGVSPFEPPMDNLLTIRVFLFFKQSRRLDKKT